MLLLCGYYTIITSYAPPRQYDYYIVRNSSSVRLLHRMHFPVCTIITSYAPPRQYDYYIVRNSSSSRYLFHRLRATKANSTNPSNLRELSIYCTIYLKTNLNTRLFSTIYSDFRHSRIQLVPDRIFKYHSNPRTLTPYFYSLLLKSLNLVLSIDLRDPL